MKSATSADELSLMVETLVRSYVAQAHAAAVAGVERGLENVHRASSCSKKPRRGSNGREPTTSPRSTKRTAAVLEEIAARLYERVRATPGGTMSQFAAELGLDIKELQLPRDLLKAQKRVRTSGVRHRTQYFPVP